MMTPNAPLPLFSIDLPVAIALINQDDQVLRFNERWQELFEKVTFHVGQKLQASISEYYPYLKTYIQMGLKGEEVTEEAVKITIDGNELFWDISLEPQFTDGSFQSVLLIIKDVTIQEKSYQALEGLVSDRTGKLEAIFDVIATASNAYEEDLGVVLQGCLDQVIDATNASGGAIQLLDSEAESLTLQAHSGLDKEIVAEMKTSSASSGLFGWTASNEEKLLLPDVTNDWRSSEVVRNSDVNVYAGVPMHSEGPVIGVLSIFRERKREFSPGDTAMLASVADQIGIIIANHELRAENARLLLIEERNRLARELHDAVTQSLYSSMLLTEALQKQSEMGNLSSVTQISAQLQTNIHQALKEMRLLIHNLRPSILIAVGLARAIHHRLNAVEGRAGIQFDLKLDGPINLPPHIEETLYFVTQEALNNSLKHAKAKEVVVRLSQNEKRIHMSITDNGVGFESSMVESGGLGLTSMKERIDQINGTLAIESIINQGTVITIEWEEKND
ncbi:MAG: signal transduction histidine kinase [Cellvibrionaceae bacterium]|jgi:signal transduction histidine kinase